MMTEKKLKREKLEKTGDEGKDNLNLMDGLAT